MKELIEFAFLPVNAGFSVMLILMSLYWIMVILGVLDIDLFDIDLDSGLETDIDFDADADIDIGTDIDADGDVDIGAEIAGGGMFRSILHFFYIGEVPIMLLFSIFTMCIWAFVILGNYYFNNNGGFIAALPVYLVSTVASLFVAKIFAMPLRVLYTMLNKDKNLIKNVVGRLCRVTTTQVSADRMGQAEIKTKGAPVILNVKAQGDSILKKGDEAVIVEQDKATGVYYIAPADLEV
jgi:hypothetical protein